MNLEKLEKNEPSQAEIMQALHEFFLGGMKSLAESAFATTETMVEGWTDLEPEEFDDLWRDAEVSVIKESGRRTKELARWKMAYNMSRTNLEHLPAGMGVVEQMIVMYSTIDFLIQLSQMDQQGYRKDDSSIKNAKVKDVLQSTGWAVTETNGEDVQWAITEAGKKQVEWLIRQPFYSDEK